MSFVSQAKDELKQVGLVTLYFMFCFAVILTLKKLFLAEYQIEFYALSAVVVGGSRRRQGRGGPGPHAAGHAFRLQPAAGAGRRLQGRWASDDVGNLRATGHRFFGTTDACRFRGLYPVVLHSTSRVAAPDR